MWVQIAILVVSLIVTTMLMPDTKAAQRSPEKLKDINFPQADEGTPIAVVFGDCWSADWTILSIGNYRTQPIEKTQEGGK